MIISKVYDVEVLRNFFSISIVDLGSYLSIFSDCVNNKGKPIPLTEKLTVKEIKQRLSSVKTNNFYITDTDDSQLLSMLNFINGMRPSILPNGEGVRHDMFGYNTNKYDSVMVACFLMNALQVNNSKELITKLYELSQRLVSNDGQDYSDYLTRIKQYKLPFEDVDLMKLFALDKVGSKIEEDGTKTFFGKGLKQTSINIKWYELLEYHMPPISEIDHHLYDKNPQYKGYTIDQLNSFVNSFDRYIISDWISEMMEYNINDVFICCELIRLNSGEISSRYKISSSYNINVRSSSRSNIADKIFNKFYSEYSGLRYNQWANKKTERPRMSFKRAIFDVISFKTNILKDLLSYMKTVVVTSIGKGSFEQEVTVNKTTYTIATGGLHSKDKPAEFKSKIIYKSKEDELDDSRDILERITDDSYIYRHWDIASYYPSLISMYSIAPKHLDERTFVKLVSTFTQNRIRAKHSKDDIVDGIDKKIYVMVLKIVLNSLYGKLGYSYGNLFDQLAVLKVTLNGQLLIMMLCEELELNGIDVISANTDGIIVKLAPNQKQIFDDISESWKQKTKLQADAEDLELYVCRDVNNYFAKEINGHITYKGAMNPNLHFEDLSKGFDMPIVAKAVAEFFISGKDVLETLYECEDILDFCKTQNVGRQYHVGYIPPVNDFNKTEGVQKIQRNVRYYVSTNGGSLLKIHNIDGSINRLSAGQKVTICNSLDDKPIYLRGISYNYYYAECLKIINPIKLGISSTQKGVAKKTKSGKSLIKKNSAQFKTLFDE